MFTRDVLREIYIILNKNLRIKLWQIYGHSPNLPMFPPAKVSLYMVYLLHIEKYTILVAVVCIMTNNIYVLYIFT